MGTVIIVVYDLLDHDPAPGGFGAEAGSHKGQFALPIPAQPAPTKR
jgi:hypothetical protein